MGLIKRLTTASGALGLSALAFGSIGASTSLADEPEVKVEEFYNEEFQDYLRANRKDLYEQLQKAKTEYIEKKSKSPAPETPAKKPAAPAPKPAAPLAKKPMLNLTGEFMHVYQNRSSDYSARFEMSRSDTKDTVVTEFGYNPEKKQKRFNIGGSINFTSNNVKGNASVFMAGTDTMTESSHGINVVAQTKDNLHFGGALERTINPDSRKSDHLVFGHLGKSFTTTEGSQTTVKFGVGKRKNSSLYAGYVSHDHTIKPAHLGVSGSAGFVTETTGDSRINASVGFYPVDSSLDFGARFWGQMSKKKNTRYEDDIVATARVAIGGGAKKLGRSAAVISELARGPLLNYPGIGYPQGYPTNYRIPPFSFDGQWVVDYTFVKKNPINLEMHKIQASHRFDDTGILKQPTVGAGYVHTRIGRTSKHDVLFTAHSMIQDRLLVYGDLSLPTTNTRDGAKGQVWIGAYHSSVLE
ncbi:hypothetical protein KY340_02750 [Candidatus Woesearchaeota archaeon]|nr:hypothetical protein [Candidatus Woesearchaeota archaeon]